MEGNSGCDDSLSSMSIVIGNGNDVAVVVMILLENDLVEIMALPSTL